MKKLILAAVLLLSKTIVSQINVTTGGTAQTLAQLIAGNGVTVTNATITCSSTGYGVFVSGNVGAGNIGISGGVLLTTGNASDAAGSESGIVSVSNSNPPTDPDILTIQNNATYNTCKLEFDIVPTCSNLTMKYVFASEEYPDYVCASVNDACGLFISGPGIVGNQNIATVPGTAIGVAINSINGGSSGIYGSSGGCTSLAYSSLFVDNAGGNQIEYGGFTVPLTASINITPCQTYHLKLVIADAGDALYDSGVFIEQNSVSCATSPTISTGSICSGQSVTLTVAGSTNGTYTWTPSTGLSTSSGSIVVASPTITTTYTVVSPGGCTGILTQTTTVTVSSAGNAGINPVSPFCETSPSTTLTSSNVGGVWSGVGITNTLTGAFSPSVAGIGNHIISYSVTSSCGSGIATTTIMVLPVSNTPTINAVSPVCKNANTLSLIANPAGGVWSGTGITNSLTGVFTPSIGTTGNNVITYSLSNSCGSAVSTTTIIVSPQPVADFNTLSVCQGTTTNYQDASSVSNGTISSWQWDYTNDGSVDNITQNPTFVFSSAGTYTSSLIVTASNSCTNSVTKSVVIYPNPVAAISTGNVCLGSASNFSATLQLTSVAVSNWNWDVNNSITSFEATGQQANYLFSSIGVYTLQLVAITNNGCYSITTNTLFVFDNPTAQFTVDNPMGCSPHCVLFSDNSTVGAPSQIANWKWEFGNNTGNVSNTNASQSVCYFNSSTSNLALYSITLTTTTDKGCKASIVNQNMVTVYPTPIASYTTTSDLGNIVNPRIVFTNQSIDYSKWWWNFGDGTNQDSVNNNPVHIYNTENPETYYSSLIVANQYGCKDTATLKVDIAPEFVFYIPNAFTPENQDGHNDVFGGVGVGIATYEIWVYDRWGVMVFYSNSITNGWNGKILLTSTLAKQDVYTWKVELKDVLGKKHSYVGHVTLLR